MPESQAIDMPEEQHPLAPFSTTSRKRKLDLQLELEQKEYNDHYSTCCSNRTTDARLLSWAAKFSMSMLALTFASVQIVRAEPCDTLLPFYTSLITFILGAYVSDTAKAKVQTAK